MKRKRGMIILLAVAFLVVFAAVNVQATKTVPGGTFITINLVNQEPDPAEPGEYVDVRFKVENNGSKGVDDVIFELLPSFPFSLEPGKSATKNIGNVQARQSGEKGIIVKYRLKVDEKAIEGENELFMRYRIANGIWMKPDDFTVKIQTHDAVLAVENVSVEGDMLKPGEPAKVGILLNNMADSLLKDIRIKLDLDDVPIAPIGTGNEKTILKINARENSLMDFKLMAEPDAEAKLYKVPIKINYFDEVGKNYTKDNMIGLIIGDKPELSVIIDSTEIYKSGQRGKVIIKFVNKGTTDIKFLNVQLKESEDFMIISEDEVYIGNIDSDDYETAEYNIYAKTKKKEIGIPIQIEYRDANNNKFGRDAMLNLKLYSEREAKKLGLSNGNGFFGFLLMILIIGAGLFYYFKRKKKKKKTL